MCEQALTTRLRPVYYNANSNRQACYASPHFFFENGPRSIIERENRNCRADMQPMVPFAKASLLCFTWRINVDSSAEHMTTENSKYATRAIPRVCYSVITGGEDTRRERSIHNIYLSPILSSEKLYIYPLSRNISDFEVAMGGSTNV